MLKRTCLGLLLLTAIACTNPTAPTITSPVFITVGPGGAQPFSVTFLGQQITAPGSFQFNLRPSTAIYSIEGTFANGTLQFFFSGADQGQGGVKSGSVAVAQGPAGAVISECGVSWALSGNAATQGQKIEVRFTVTADSSQACQ